MSVYTKFYTLQAMVKAIVHDVSSDMTAHPAEHALILEPNFAWQVENNDQQHHLTVDLTRPFDINSLIWIHREDEAVSPSPYGMFADVYYSNDDVTYTKATLDVDPGINAKLLKVAEFSVTGNYRYWKISIRGTDYPSYYAPDDMRISAVWWAKKHELSAGSNFTLDDKTIVPGKSYDGAYGEKLTVGFGVNERKSFDRVYVLDDTDYATLLSVLAECDGGSTPVVLQELTDDPIIVKINKMVSTKFAIGWQSVNMSFETVPMVARDEYY